MIGRTLIGAGLALSALVVAAVANVDQTLVATVIGGGLGMLIPGGTTPREP
jgi:hypothetical protein